MMLEKLKQTIRSCRKALLERTDLELYDVLTTLCLLVPNNDEGTSFSLQITCGAGNSEDEEGKPLILFDESTPFTTDEFKRFMKHCSEKYLGQLEVLIPPFLAIFYGFADVPTVEDAEEVINDAIDDKDWSLVKGGLGFRIIDRTI